MRKNKPSGQKQPAKVKALSDALGPNGFDMDKVPREYKHTIKPEEMAQSEGPLKPLLPEDDMPDNDIFTVEIVK